MEADRLLGPTWLRAVVMRIGLVAQHEPRYEHRIEFAGPDDLVGNVVRDGIRNYLITAA